MPLPSCRKRRHSPVGNSSSDAQSGDSSSNVKVVVRVRPENEKEAGSRVVTQVMNENVLVFDPKENSESGLSSRKRPRDLRKRQNRDLTFAFDHVFCPESTTSEIYEQTTKSILTGLLNGYNCSVFAYGATGAGKTHTMLGSKEQPGVMYLTMVDLYNRIEAIKDTKTCDVAVSYLEVYNETIRDLLMPSGCLPIREDPANGVVIPGLSLHKPKTAEELLYMLQVGNQHRTQHPTDANAESSRSHAVFQVFIRQKDRTANLSTEVRIAKLCLVDLAGSERATVTKNRGSRFREGANINRSLLALGNVINALAENKNKGFIPYRDSKLTRLLKDSLGGNCQTVMIAAVSPSSLSFEDTYNTLRYADRAKNIKSTLKKNVLNVDFHIAKYGQIVEELRKEIVELKEKLRKCEEQSQTATTAVQQTGSHDYTGFYEDINSGFTPVLTCRNEQLNSEVGLRELQWKMYRKERCLARLQVLDEPGNKETVEKLHSLVSGMNQKSEFLATKADASLDKVVEGSNTVTELKQRLLSTLGVSDGNLPQPLSHCFEVNILKTELQDTSKHIDYLKRSIRFQQRELQHNERLVHKLLKIIKRQHYIIKGHNMMTSDLQNDYMDIQQIAAGQELQWEDLPEDSIFLSRYKLADMVNLPCLSKKLTLTDTSLPECASQSTVRQNYSLLSCSKSSGLLSVSSVSCLSETPAAQLPQTDRIANLDECSPAKVCRVEMPATKTDPASRIINHIVDSDSTSLTGGLNTATDVYINSNSSPVRNCSEMDFSRVKVDEIDDKSPEDDYVPKTKFTKINDTITKCKKYVRLHTADLVKNEELASHSELNESYNLDGTFTLDPSSSNVPLSAIPCVDNVPSAHHSSECSNSAHFCQCAKLETEFSNRNPDYCNTNNRFSMLNRNSTCDKCKCAVKPHSETLTGSQHGAHDPNDDSGASTLVNSQATVSTLSDSQNLSSILEYVDVARTSHGTLLTKNHRNRFLSTQPGSLSETFTKDDAVCSVAHDQSDPKVHAARSIKFDEEGGRENVIGGKTSSLIMKTPDRKPLKQVGSSNFSPNSKPLRVSALTRSHSMVVKSLMGNKGSYSFKTKSFTPNYMKPTKAAARRFEVKTQPADTSDSSESKTNMTQLKKLKTAFFSRKPRPLMHSMRSKSTSNLSSRAAWQL